MKLARTPSSLGSDEIVAQLIRFLSNDGVTDLEVLSPRALVPFLSCSNDEGLRSIVVLSKEAIFTCSETVLDSDFVYR